MSMRRRSREVSVFGASALDLFASALAAFIVITLIMLPFFLRYDEVLLDQILELEERLAFSEESRQQTQAALEQTQLELQQTQAELDQTQSELQQTQTELEQTQSELQQTQAELDQTQLELQQTQTELEQTQTALESCERERNLVGSELAQCVDQLNSTFLTTMIRWDTMADVDLHVIDPAGNEFYYGETSFPGIAGELTRDIIQGPGIEVYEEPGARTGTFQIRYNLYSGDPVQVDGVIYSRQGRQELPSIRLEDEQMQVSVARVTVNADGTVDVVTE